MHIMNLQFDSTRMISDIQKDFNVQFPFLKLEFFQNNDSRKAPLSPKNRVMHNRRIGELQPSILNCVVEIRDNMKVKELEGIFKNQMGLFVQVFRRSGNLWLETTMTDNWTLRQQNEHGREISSVEKKKIILDTDEYDLNRDSN